MFMLRDFYGARRVTVIGFLFYFVLLHYANLFQTFFLHIFTFGGLRWFFRLSWLVSSLNQFSLHKCVLDHLSGLATHLLQFLSFFLVVMSHSNNHRVGKHTTYLHQREADKGECKYRSRVIRVILKFLHSIVISGVLRAETDSKRKYFCSPNDFLIVA